jgi:hypothetical protein
MRRQPPPIPALRAAWHGCCCQATTLPRCRQTRTTSCRVRLRKSDSAIQRGKENYEGLYTRAGLNPRPSRTRQLPREPVLNSDATTRSVISK